MSGRILVAGSLNMDLVTYLPELPKTGETVKSSDFRRIPGGKGANQAAAAAKLGADVAMIGKVGRDEFGDILIQCMEEAGVQAEGIMREGTTGMAFIQVASSGDNTIVLVPGANGNLRPEDIDRLSSMVRDCSLVVMQLEIPLDVVEHVVRLAAEYGKEVILNPAPAPAEPLPSAILKGVQTMTPNETELQTLTGMPVSTLDEIRAAAERLQSLGPKRVIVTMGDNGAYMINEEERLHIPGYRVQAVDATAAGDSFTAAFAVGKLRGMSDREAVVFANKVAAVVVTRHGALPSLPTWEQVEHFYRDA